MKKANNRWVTLYPLVHKFFRGYLHQDFPEQYGSVPGAVRAFKEDVGRNRVRYIRRTVEPTHQ